MMKKYILPALLTLSLPSLAANYQAGDFVVRGGVTNVNPTSSYNKIFLGDTDSTMTLSVDDNSQLGLNFVYFYDSQWAFEVLAATPFKHSITIQDPNAILNVDGAKLAEVSHLPPTISVLRYFDTTSSIKPYVGIGVNYTVFFDEEFETAPQSLGLDNLALDSSFGMSLQAGVDFLLNDNWHINTSVRYIGIDTDAKFSVAGQNIGSSKVEIDPMVYSLLVGYKF